MTFENLEYIRNEIEYSFNEAETIEKLSVFDSKRLALNIISSLHQYQEVDEAATLEALRFMRLRAPVGSFSVIHSLTDNALNYVQHDGNASDAFLSQARVQNDRFCENEFSNMFGAKVQVFTSYFKPNREDLAGVRKHFSNATYPARFPELADEFPVIKIRAAVAGLQVLLAKTLRGYSQQHIDPSVEQKAPENLEI